MRGPVAAAAALALGAGIIGWTQLAPDPVPGKPPATCSPTHVIPGEYRCSLPTHSDARAVIYVQTFEDGSARATTVDPDQEGYAP